MKEDEYSLNKKIGQVARFKRWKGSESQWERFGIVLTAKINYEKVLSNGVMWYDLCFSGCQVGKYLKRNKIGYMDNSYMTILSV